MYSMLLMDVFPALLFLFVGHSTSQDIRSLKMTTMNGWQLACATSTCSPFLTVQTPNVQQCRVTCLSHTQCQAVTFQRSTYACALFAYTPNVNVDLSLAGNTTISIVEMGTRMPPAPGQCGYSLVWRGIVYRSYIGCGLQYIYNIELEVWRAKSRSRPKGSRE